jgi:hypothetical protein
VRSRTIIAAGLITVATACASSGPHLFGQYNDLGPKVAAVKGERAPTHLDVTLSRPANVAIFLVVPGRASTLVYPADSTESEHLDAGTHQVQTAIGRAALSDTSRLVRRPNASGMGGIGGEGGGRGRMQGGNYGTASRDSVANWLGAHGYLLVFAAQEPMSYAALAHRVAGLTVPIEDNDALNTVAKLIRESTKIVGPWSAYATDYPP